MRWYGDDFINRTVIESFRSRPVAYNVRVKRKSKRYYYVMTKRCCHQLRSLICRLLSLTRQHLNTLWIYAPSRSENFPKRAPERRWILNRLNAPCQTHDTGTSEMCGILRTRETSHVIVKPIRACTEGWPAQDVGGRSSGTARALLRFYAYGLFPPYRNTRRWPLFPRYMCSEHTTRVLSLPFVRIHYTRARPRMITRTRKARISL